MVTVPITCILLKRTAFLELFENDQAIAGKIKKIFAKRNEELAFREPYTGSGMRSDGDFQPG